MASRYTDTDTETDRKRKGKNKTGQTEDRINAETEKDRQETQETHNGQETRDATDRKRETWECLQDDRDGERRGAWRVCGWCVYVSCEARGD